MNTAFEKFILKHRAICEMPSVDGVPMCMKPSTHLVQLSGKLMMMYTMAVCDV
jgi:hypothetical protein